MSISFCRPPLSGLTEVKVAGSKRKWFNSMTGLHISDLKKALGPGILVACAAIGGSHLVWSTKAGAQYGWSLVGLILLANLFKYPFFLYGQKYTAATGESLLAGYKRQGIGYLWTFVAVNILTGIINIAGVAMLSGALLSDYGLESVGVVNLSVAILLVCGVMLLFGQYRLLDSVSKIIIIIFVININII